MDGAFAKPAAKAHRKQRRDGRESDTRNRGHEERETDKQAQRRARLEEWKRQQSSSSGPESGFAPIAANEPGRKNRPKVALALSLGSDSAPSKRAAGASVQHKASVFGDAGGLHRRRKRKLPGSSRAGDGGGDATSVSSPASSASSDPTHLPQESPMKRSRNVFRSEGNSGFLSKKKSGDAEESTQPVDGLDEFMAIVQAEVDAVAAKDHHDTERDSTSGALTGDQETVGETESASDGETTLEEGTDKPLVLEPFQKKFYAPVPEVMRMTREETRLYRRDELEGTKVRGKNVEKPIRRFTQCGLPDRVLRCLVDECGYDQPTPVQCQGLPCLLSGRDVIACAKTGSGKTLAFALPALVHCLGQRRVRSGEGPIAMILIPTRELCVQVWREIARLCRSMSSAHGGPGPGALSKGEEVRCIAVHGGADVSGQFAQLKRGAEIVVATPGRMIDVLLANNGRITNLRRCTFVVLDEADRMFDMGFEPQITRLLFNTRRDRQTALFSATFPWAVEALARQILRQEHNPVEIVVGARSVVSDTVTQFVEVMQEPGMKFPRLLQILKDYAKKGKVLVFVDRQETCDAVFRQLTTKEGVMCLTLHGGLNQDDRDNAIDEFKTGDIHTLIATSVAARGLDVPELILVVNFDAPNHLEDYVHRVGRTGRAGNRGTAITFLVDDDSEKWLAPDITRAMKDSKAAIPQELAALNERVLELRRQERAKAPRRFDSAKSTSSRGFGGTGLETQAAREKAKQMERQQQAQVFGAFAAPDVDPAANFSAGDEPDAGQEEFPEAADAPDDVLEMRAQEKRASASGAAGKATQAPAMDPADAKIQALLGKVESQMKKGHAGGEILASGVEVHVADSGQRHYEFELDINDVNQIARGRVTHKDCLNQISDLCNVSITPRGVFVPAGRKPPPGETKLALLIEGGEERFVVEAKKELQSIVSEAGSLGFGGPTGGFTGSGGYQGAGAAAALDYAGMQRRQFLTYK